MSTVLDILRVLPMVATCDNVHQGWRCRCTGLHCVRDGKERSLMLDVQAEMMNVQISLVRLGWLRAWW
jgi:hypothetical protein